MGSKSCFFCFFFVAQVSCSKVIYQLSEMKFMCHILNYLQDPWDWYYLPIRFPWLILIMIIRMYKYTGKMDPNYELTNI